MRKSFVAMTVIAVALSAAPAAPAGAADLRAHQMTARANVFGMVDDTTFAYSEPRPGGITAVALRGDDGRTRTVLAPDGCRLSGAGQGLLTGECGTTAVGSSAETVALFVQRPDGTVVTRLSATISADLANGGGGVAPRAIGDRWIDLPNGAKDSPPWTTAVDWHNGEVRDDLGLPTGPPDARHLLDLDAPGLVVPLCSPLRRYPGLSFEGTTSWADAIVRGRWALLQNPDETFVLRRCGSSRPVALPKGFVPSALGDGWVAGTTRIAHRSPRVDVVRLSDRRRFTVAGVPGQMVNYGTLSLTRARLYASYDGVFTVKLPGR
jgi:hypothetical protein